MRGSLDLQRVAVFGQIHVKLWLCGKFWALVITLCLKWGVFLCRIETWCQYANLYIIFHGKANCFISVVSFRFSGVLNLLFQDSKSVSFFCVTVMLRFL